MSKAQRDVALVNAIIPRAGKLPADMAALLSADPMSTTLRYFGGEKRVQQARSAAIADMIAQSLATNGQA